MWSGEPVADVYEQHREPVDLVRGEVQRGFRAAVAELHHGAVFPLVEPDEDRGVREQVQAQAHHVGQVGVVEVTAGAGEDVIVGGQLGQR